MVRTQLPGDDDCSLCYTATRAAMQQATKVAQQAPKVAQEALRKQREAAEEAMRRAEESHRMLPREVLLAVILGS